MNTLSLWAHYQMPIVYHLVKMIQIDATHPRHGHYHYISVTMLVRKSSEKGVVFGLQTRTVKPEKGVYLVGIFPLVDLLASSASTNFMTSQMKS